MLSFLSRGGFRMQTGAAALVLGATAATAAGGIPDLEISVQELTTGFSQTFNPPGSSLNGIFTFDAGLATPNFTISGDVNAIPNIGHALGAQLGTTLTFANHSSTDTLEFLISITLPMSTGQTPVEWGTSTSLTLSGPVGFGPTMFTLPDSPFWTVLTDGSAVGTLGDAPSGLFASAGSADLSLSPIFGTDGPIQESISIQLAFSLTPQATGGFNGIFLLVPSPAALGLFAIAGLIGPRRRRQN